jgi:cysteine desulfurase
LLCTILLFRGCPMDYLYLDNNATTLLHPAVAETMAAYDRAGYANPASQHQAGRRARSVLEEAREGIAKILGANVSDTHADQVIFTSGGTEANNLALRGLAGDRPGRVIISAIEHPSVVGAAEQLARQGFDVQRLRVSREGVVDVDHLRELLDQQMRVVSVMLGNNETGVLQPVAEVAAVCHSGGVPVHTDAVQVVGKLPVDFRQLGVSALSLSAHKFHGPRGIGALIVRHGVELTPILFGGFQQLGLRPGTESVTLAVGLHRALQLWQDEADERASRMARLRDRLEERLLANVPDLVINGAGAARLPHTSNVAFPGLDRQALLMALDMAGVACSTGSACASGSSEPSPVLLAMGCPADIVEGSLRLSLSAFTTEAEIDQAAGRIRQVFNDLHRKKELGISAATSRKWNPKPL